MRSPANLAKLFQNDFLKTCKRAARAAVTRVKYISLGISFAVVFSWIQSLLSNFFSWLISLRCLAWGCGSSLFLFRGT